MKRLDDSNSNTEPGSERRGALSCEEYELDSVRDDGDGMCTGDRLRKWNVENIIWRRATITKIEPAAGNLQERARRRPTASTTQSYRLFFGGNGAGGLSWTNHPLSCFHGARGSNLPGRQH